MSLYAWFKQLETTLRRSLKKSKQQQTKFEKLQEKFYKEYPDYKVGIGTYGIPKVHDWFEGTTLRIGNYCSISHNVHIYLGGGHRTDWVSSYPFSAYLEEAEPIPGTGVTKGDVVIGNDVWIAANAIILSGVTIGDGAVIANNALVTKDVEPYAIVGGNPAKAFGYRFKEKTRQRLQASRWWDWPEEEIRSVYKLLNADDFQPFWDYLEKRNAKSASQ